jgi:translation initiation factor IF-1
MSRHDLSRVQGVIAGVLAMDNFSVDLKNGRSIRARVSGRLRRLHASVAVGDWVTVGVSPDNIGRGLIMASAKLLPKRAS